MREIESVAVAGATGNLGPHIVQALIDTNFEITVITRSRQRPTYDTRVKVVEVDYSSKSSLTIALKGIDALVSAIPTAVSENQVMLIDAAIAAGVKRFIPSEYGSCTTNPKLEAMPVYASAFKVRHYLQSNTNQITWTVLAPGAFLEFLFGLPMVLDFANHRATLFDEGNNRFSSTSMPNIGKAIAGVMNNSEACKNRVVRVSEVILTQNALLKIAESLQPDTAWTVSKVLAKTVLAEGLEGIQAGEFDTANVMKVIMGTAFAGEEYGAAYDENDNDLLGIRQLEDGDLRSIVAERLALQPT